MPEYDEGTPPSLHTLLLGWEDSRNALSVRTETLGVLPAKHLAVGGTPRFRTLA